MHIPLQIVDKGRMPVGFAASFVEVTRRKELAELGVSPLLHSPSDRQDQFEVVLLENLVPQGHLLRKVQKYIDFSFIREKVWGLYCEDNGRSSVDPVVLFQMLFLGCLYGIRSERRLVEEIQVNLAYRWFLGLHIEDPVPHHSTISQNRRRRFLDNNIAQEIFDEIVRQ